MARILCSSTDLNFGECNASKFEVQIGDISDISDLKIEVYEIVDGYEGEVPLFSGDIASAKMQSGGYYRKIVAYDGMYRHANDNVSEWYVNMFSSTQKPEYQGVWSPAAKYLSGDVVAYGGEYYQYLCSASARFNMTTYDGNGNTINMVYVVADYIVGMNPEEILADSFVNNYVQQLAVYNPYNYGSVTVKEFRDSLFAYVGIVQGNAVLLNDGVEITRTVDSNEITFSDCIKAICQMNACFGHFDARGLFQYVYIGGKTVDYTRNYREASTNYEEYQVSPISSVRIYDNAGEVSTIYGAGDNYWDISGNFLLYSLPDAVLNGVAKTLYDYVSTITYVPAELAAIFSLPVDMGSTVTFSTHTGDVITTYALQDTMSGAQMVTQKIKAAGNKTRNQSMSLSDSLNALEAKTTAIVEEIYTTITANTAKIKTIYGDLANYKVVVADELQAVTATIENLNVSALQARIATIEEAYINIADVESLLVSKAYITAADVETLLADKAYITAADIETLLADKAYITAADIETLLADKAYITKADIGDLYAAAGQVDVLTGELSSYKTSVAEQLVAIDASISDLSAKDAEIENALIGFASAIDLEAISARTQLLEANYADIATLVNGNLTSANIQSLTLTSENTVIENGMIKSAMIESLAADKITGLDINTTKLTVHSEDGKSTWADNTIQISDGVIVRVQIGEDAAGDYNLYLWDAAGRLLWDAAGVTEAGLNDGIIKDVAVAEDANISASKLNIESVVTEINGATTKIKSSSVLFDEENQTLDIAFNTLETALKDTQDNSVSGVTVLYALSDSPTIAPVQGWSAIAPSWEEGKYMWQKTATYYGDGSCEESEPTCLSGASGQAGQAGEDATVLRIDSSRGTVFKNNMVSTVLTAVIYHGGNRITDKAGLAADYGAGAYLEWSWQRMDDDRYGVISADDSRIGDGGFSFTLSAADVDTKVTFQCALVV